MVLVCLWYVFDRSGLFFNASECNYCQFHRVHHHSCAACIRPCRASPFLPGLLLCSERVSELSGSHFSHIVILHAVCIPDRGRREHIKSLALENLRKLSHSPQKSIVQLVQTNRQQQQQLKGNQNIINTRRRVNQAQQHVHTHRILMPMFFFGRFVSILSLVEILQKWESECS